ncbi:MAG: putative peptidoglycan binding domain-containing protein, partial [Thermocrispum sp.]
VDLRADDHADPCAELSRLLDLHELFHGATAEEDRLAVDDELRAELDRLARAAGRADFDAWVGAENFENRVWRDGVDRQVVEILRAQAQRATP